MGRNRTVLPCSVGRRTRHVPGPTAADRSRTLQMTRTDDDDRRQTMPTDDSVQNNTGPVIFEMVTQGAFVQLTWIE